MLVAMQCSLLEAIFFLSSALQTGAHMGSFHSANHRRGHDAIRLLCHIDHISRQTTCQGTRRGDTRFTFHFTLSFINLIDWLSEPAANWSAMRSDFRHRSIVLSRDGCRGKRRVWLEGGRSQICDILVDAVQWWQTVEQHVQVQLRWLVYRFEKTGERLNGHWFTLN